jgi:hypothetical protein
MTMMPALKIPAMLLKDVKILLTQLTTATTIMLAPMIPVILNQAVLILPLFVMTTVLALLTPAMLLKVVFIPPLYVTITVIALLNLVTM